MFLFLCFNRMLSGPGWPPPPPHTCAELWLSPAPLIWQVSAHCPPPSTRQMKISLKQEANMLLSRHAGYTWKIKSVCAVVEVNPERSGPWAEVLLGLDFDPEQELRPTLKVGTNVTFVIVGGGRLKVTNASLPSFLRPKKEILWIPAVPWLFHKKQKVFNWGSWHWHVMSCQI